MAFRSPCGTIWKSVAILIKDIHQVIGVINEEFNVIKLISLIEFDEKPSRRLFCRRRRKQPEMQDFVRFGINGAIQPVVVAIDANHLLINHKLIRAHRGNGL